MKLLNISPSHPLHKALTDDSKTSEQGTLYMLWSYYFVCCAGFLATLLLSLPLLALHNNNTVDVGTQVDPRPEDSVNRKCVCVCVHACEHVCACACVRACVCVCQ